MFTRKPSRAHAGSPRLTHHADMLKGVRWATNAQNKDCQAVTGKRAADRLDDNYGWHDNIKEDFEK